MCFGTNVVATEKSNYVFSSQMMLPPVTVASMANLKFDWSGLHKDFLGRAVNPAQDLDLALVMLWSLPLTDFQKALNADTLFTSDLIVSPPLGLLIKGKTSAQLHDMKINDTSVSVEMFNEYFDAAQQTPANSTLLVAVQTGTGLGRGIRMLQSFQLDTKSTATDVALTDNSTKLTYSANLHDLTITGVPARTAGLTLDWSQMTKNALGAEFKPSYITSAVVSHFTQTPAELETKFLDLEAIATATYRADVPSGSVLDFTTLKDSGGAAFPGVDDTGTWVIGLVCGNCRNPAPWYLTILEPCTP
jgi:hypothetical protein